MRWALAHMQYAYIYIFQKTAYVHIYLEERKNRQLFVDQFSTYTYHLMHEFDLRSPISCKKIFYIRAILIFRRFYKIMETRSVLIVCTYVRTYCTCVNCISSVHYAVSRFQQLAEDEALNFKLGKWAQQVGLSVKWD